MTEKTEDLLEELVSSGLGVNEQTPAFIEAVAIALGYKTHGGETVADSLSSIAASLERIATALENPK